MIERPGTMTFAPASLVFPGGRVEEDDELLAPGDPLGAARVTAIRETLEETGVAISIAPMPAAASIAAWRARLKAGVRFSALLGEVGAHLEPDALAHFAHWCPPAGPARRFDTHFFVARATEPQAVIPDVDEVAGQGWFAAQSVLDAWSSGQRKIIFPTLRNLERLACFPRFADVLAHLAQTQVRRISVRRREEARAIWACIPEGLGYPVTCARFPDDASRERLPP